MCLIFKSFVISLNVLAKNALPLSETIYFGILNFKITLSTIALAAVSAVQSNVGTAIMNFVGSHAIVKICL